MNQISHAAAERNRPANRIETDMIHTDRHCELNQNEIRERTDTGQICPENFDNIKV